MSWIAGLWQYLLDILIPFRKAPGEQVVIYERQSLLVLLASFRGVILAAILLVVLVVRSPQIHLVIFRQSISMYQLISPVLLLGAFLLLAYQIHLITQWLFRVYVVTSRRIFTREGILARRIQEARLDKVQNVSDTTAGALRNLFSIGNVRIETAGIMGGILFVDVDYPRFVATQTMEAVQQRRTELAQLEQREIIRLLRETLSL